MAFFADMVSQTGKTVRRTRTGGYRMGLLERIGLPEIERLENDNVPRKWSKDQLRQIAADYRRKARELEQ